MSFWRSEERIAFNTIARSCRLKTAQNLGAYFSSSFHVELWMRLIWSSNATTMHILIQIRVWIAFHRRRKLEFIRKTERLVKCACCEHPPRWFRVECIFVWKLQIICLWCQIIMTRIIQEYSERDGEEQCVYHSAIHTLKEFIVVNEWEAHPTTSGFKIWQPGQGVAIINFEHNVEKSGMAK